MGAVKYSGPMASFHCPTEATIRSLKVHFSPKQLGSGTPSPENVREIEGWDGVEVYHGDKTVVWNQWLKPYDSTNWQPHSTYINVTFSNGIATSEWVSKATGYRASIINTTGTLQSEGQIWYASYMVKSDKEHSYGIELCGGRQHYAIVTTGTNEWYHVSAVDSYYRGTRNYTYVANCSSPATDDMIGMIVYSKSPLLINLTQMFGAGNEPTKEEFESQCALNGIDLTEYHDYNEGVEIPWKTNNTETYQIEFGVLGKNKFDYASTTFIQGIRGNDGEFVSDSVSHYTEQFIPVIPATEYTLSGNNLYSGGYVVRIYYSDANKNWISKTSGDRVNVLTFTTPSDCYYIQIQTNSNNTNPETWQLELGSTATAYEPYNPNKTVYGGWVDLISGEVCEEWKPFDLTELALTQFGIGENVLIISAFPGAIKSRNAMYCNFLPPVSNPNISGVEGVDWNSSRMNMCLSINRGLDTQAKVEQWLADMKTEGTTPTIVADMVTPNTYHLAPTQLQTFLGQNNVWSNADYVEVEYDLHETQDILKRKQFIIASQPHVEKLAAAPLQSFETDMVAPIRECKVHFEPKQDLNGYDKPWVGGNGKNLLNVSTDNIIGNVSLDNKIVVTETGFNFIQSAICGFWVKVKPNTTYTYSYTSTYNGSNMHARVYESSEKTDSWSYDKLTVNTTSWPGSETFTTSENTNWLIVGAYAYGEGLNSSLTNMQLEEGSTATSYEPYENICPIEGWTDLRIHYSGKNLLHITDEGVQNTFSLDFPGGILSFSANSKKENGKPQFVVQDYNGDQLTYYTMTYTDENNRKYRDNINMLEIPRCRINSSAYDVQAELGTMHTNYEPFKGSVKTINWIDLAGTIYGGYIDLINGEVVAEYGIVDLGTLPWHDATRYGKGLFMCYGSSFQNAAAKNWIGVSDKYFVYNNTYQYLDRYATHGIARAYLGENGTGIAIKDVNITLTDAATMKAGLSGVNLVYQLLTPIHYSLTLEQFKSLRGTNNIWSNANGNIELSYWTH